MPVIRPLITCASDQRPMTSWWLEVKRVDAVTDCIFMGSKITADIDCSHKIKTFALWKESYDKPRQCIKKQKHHLPAKVHIVKNMVFPVVMYRHEGWTIKKAEHQRIDAFELWCWRTRLRIPSTARSNQSILKGIDPEYSLKGLMLKLKLQYFGHMMRRADSLE